MTHSDPAVAISTTTAAPSAGWALADGLRAIAGVETLHGRDIPGTRARVEHIAVGPSGVYVIEAHESTGPAVRRDRRLFVGPQDRSDLLAAIKVPVDAVAAALGDLHLPISRALCFIGGEWSALHPPFMLRGVWIGPPNPLFGLVSQPGRLQPREIADAVSRLDALLPVAD
jgi:hypothetical protein